MTTHAQTSARVRIGLVGAGTHVQSQLIPGLQRIPGVELVVICNRSEASSRRVATAHTIARIARTWQEVVRAPDVDAVVVGTWPSLHAEVTVAALEQRKHVLTEGRMARSLAEAQQMWSTAHAHPDRIAQIVPSPVGLDVELHVRQLLHEGALGELREILVTQTGSPYVEASAPLQWRQDTDKSGIHTLTLGILHEVLQRWFREAPQWVMADAQIYTDVRVDPHTGSRKAVTIPDSLGVLARYPSGTRLMYHLSGVEAGPGRGEIRLNGSKMCLRYDVRSGHLYRARSSSPKETMLRIPKASQRGWKAEHDFITSIRTGTPPTRTGFDQGFQNMRFVDAVWTSWTRDGTRVTIPPIDSQQAERP